MSTESHAHPPAHAPEFSGDLVADIESFLSRASQAYAEYPEKTSYLAALGIVVKGYVGVPQPPGPG